MATRESIFFLAPVAHHDRHWQRPVQLPLKRSAVPVAKGCRGFVRALAKLE
jgi:hypothetical protein